MAHRTARPASVPPASGAPVDDTHVHRVVGIGSSAGGLEALQEFLTGVEPGTGSAFVIAQHLSPERPSLIVELLARATTLTVATAHDGLELTPDLVVIGPPNADISVVGDTVHVVAPAERFGPSPSVDLLFASIAEQWGSRSAAVVLSGTGSDGAHGLRAVRAAGGLTMVQSPIEARFDGMPTAALALGGVDITARARELGQRLSQIAPSAPSDAGATDPDPHGLAGTIALVRRASGIDFSQYKEPTVRRQIQRRMAIRQVQDIDDYLPLLAADPEEVRALVSRLLVTVTSFFRDRESFAALSSELTSYLADRSPDNVIRIWVPGCATGEEAYSLAMIVSDILGDPPDLSRRLKVFGTDLDENSLAIARKATYAFEAVQQIPEELRGRYVVEVGTEMKVLDALRDCVVFARHDVGQDPPFPRMDLISCRNTLIYFTTALQDRALALMEYSLNTRGLLFLGASESLGHRDLEFDQLDPDHRIFSRSEGRSAPPSVTARRVGGTAPPVFGPAGRVAVMRDVVPEQHTAMLEALVRTMPHPLVVLDEDHHLLEVVGDVSAFCRLPQGEITTAVASFLAPELQAEARALLLLCRAQAEAVTGRHIRLDDEAATVRLEAEPLSVGSRNLTVLRFLVEDPTPDALRATPVRDRDFDVQLERLERELIASQDTLRRSMADLEVANEELEASSEELQAASEELQATNEELEASNEELQATNEQLSSMNQVLRMRGEEIELVNTDLVNIQSSLNQGMLIIDEDLKVVRFSPLAVRVFGLADEDIGTPISRVPTTIEIPGLGEAVRSVAAGAPRVSIEASDEGGAAFIIQVLPYQEKDGRRHGAIITITDVAEMVELRHHAELAVRDFEHLTDALDEVVWKRQADMGRFIYVSERMSALTGWQPADVITQDGLLDEAIDPRDRDAVAAVRTAGTGRWSTTYRVTFPRGDVTWVKETGSPVVDESGTYLVGTLADVTETQRLAEKANDASDILRTVFDTSRLGVVILDSDYRILESNTAFAAMVGFEATSIIGTPATSFLAESRRGTALAAANVGASAEGATELNGDFVHRDGTTRAVTGELRILPHRIGEAFAIAVVQDVTELREKTELLTTQAAIDTSTGLLNRRTFTEALDKEIARCQRSNTILALAWIDLDGFKDINDEHGHEIGDHVLRTTAERITSVVRGSDIVGRIGGDEYGVVITDYERPEELEIVLDRIISVLHTPIWIGDLSVSTSGSVGIALYPEDGTKADELIRDADAAMYAIKRKGGNSYTYFAESINAAADERRRLRATLATALIRGEFELHYQPIVELNTERLWGVEALLRWRRDGVLVPACDFVPFAEESHQIKDLGMATFGLLREDLGTMRDAGRGGIHVSVNMSVTQLEDQRLFDLLNSWPSASGLDGLVVEVLESIFLPGNREAMANLRLLGQQGALVSIDDFGTGYSNMTLLAGLSPSLVKIDRSLLGDRIDVERRTQLFRACVDLIHSIGALAVAEGVESPEQQAFASGLGADLIQGYLVAYPMPMDELIAWIGEHQSRIP